MTPSSNFSMPNFEEVRGIAQSLHVSPSFESLKAQLLSLTRRFGFRNYILTAPELAIDGRPLLLSDLPLSCVAHFGDSGAWSKYPVLAHCRRRVAPFFWHELETDDGQKLTSADAGLTQEPTGQRQDLLGWTVPVHALDGGVSLGLFIGPANQRPIDEALPSMQYLVLHAIHALRRLHAAHAGRSSTSRLTPRQIECLVLAARGKSDWVVGQLLGLSPATVHKYLEHAKARYGVASRTELVVRALRDGHVSFDDVIDGESLAV